MEKERFVSSSQGSANTVQFLYLHKYFYGGGTTFTTHLLYRLSLSAQQKPTILRLNHGFRSERKVRDFGYGLSYRNISQNALDGSKNIFITLYKDYYLHLLPNLSETFKDAVLVIHDHRDISSKILKYINDWQLVTIRKTVQSYIKEKYNLDSLFLYHPFYEYPTITNKTRKGAISISRISYEKNTDIIVRANRLLDTNNIIKIYGCPSRMYVHLFLGGYAGDFNKYYYGKFEKSFLTLSNILSTAKFVVDLSSFKIDGGGSQYTFLEAIHNDCALILHRDWIENRYVKPEYCDFKESYNCFAVDNETELADLIKKIQTRHE